MKKSNQPITARFNIDNNVYNGARKLVVADSDFMSPFDKIECEKQLKIKNCEGYDRIPQRVLIVTCFDNLTLIYNVHLVR